MIDPKALRKTDARRWVEYCPSAGPKEKGRIKSWNERWIFVVYHCGGDWNSFQNYTAAATEPEDLIFTTEDKELSHGRHSR